VAISDKPIEAEAAGRANRPTIYVCVTCRGPDGIVRDPLPGQLVAAATARAAHGSDVDVRLVRCLANCSRGPSVAMRANGSWTYIFGGLDAASAPALITGAQMLAAAPDGILPWRGRPDVLKRGLVGRIPPVGFEEMP
jgi:predicted metal-binding protein